MPPPAPDAAAILTSDATTSDKIRALNAAGYPRADIARMLGKRYQHVRNVLEDDKAREAGEGMPPQIGAHTGSGFAEGAAEFKHRVEERLGGRYRFVIGRDGAIALPEAVMAALKVKPGDALVGHLDGETFTLVGPQESMRRLRTLIRQYADPNVSLVDELIAERRAETAREEADG